MKKSLSKVITATFCYYICFGVPNFYAASADEEAKPGSLEVPLQYEGPPLPNASVADGRLRYSPGVQNIQISRANRKFPPHLTPAAENKKGWTYQHHVDLSVWRGRLYAAWDMTTGKEDTPPFHVVYATSTDGFAWSTPRDLFPFNQAWNQRFYFYHASNNRMLAFACGANPENGKKKISEAIKKTVIVREILPNHDLGGIYTLIAPGPGLPPLYTESSDGGFIAACREACNNKPLLEQQDYGNYLGEQRMKWHDATNWPSGDMNVTGYPFGKALCFFHRKDGVLVGLCKMGFVTLSSDEGRTWSLPVIPKTLIAGKGKVWAQKTPDNRYAMIYPPQRPGPRYPMAITTSDDGISFRDMRLIHGEVPPIRYGASRSKSNGPQYLRGIAEWAGDASGLDKESIWVAYSVNQEDIWVSRIPVPVVAETRNAVHDTFEDVVPGPQIPGWNTYSPIWAQVSVAAGSNPTNHYLELNDREAADYARAVRTFPSTSAGEISFRLSAAQTGHGRLEVDVLGEQNSRPVRLWLDDHGNLQARDGKRSVTLANYTSNEWSQFTITIKKGHFTVVRDGRILLQNAAFAESSPTVYALSFRTGEFRSKPLSIASQREDLMDTEDPLSPTIYRIDEVSTSPGAASQQ